MENQTTKSPFDVQILAARLKDLMRESVPKVTQKDLAAALGTAPNMVSAYMHGKSCPSLPMAVNIAQYFDVSIDYLAGLADHRRQQVIVSAPASFANRRRRKTAAHIIKTANAEWAAKTAKVKPQHHDNTKGD